MVGLLTPFELEVYLVRPEAIPAILQLFDHFGLEFLGPGCRMRRAGPKDEPGTALYEFAIWDTRSFYASILPQTPLRLTKNDTGPYFCCGIYRSPSPCNCRRSEGPLGILCGPKSPIG